jgi:hypothetical protein
MSIGIGFGNKTYKWVKCQKDPCGKTKLYNDGIGEYTYCPLRLEKLLKGEKICGNGKVFIPTCMRCIFYDGLSEPIRLLKITKDMIKTDEEWLKYEKILTEEGKIDSNSSEKDNISKIVTERKSSS